MPTPPPRDAAGAVTPHDHTDIDDADVVIRRISELQVSRDKDGKRRISSLAYQGSGSNGGMSVDVLPFVVADGRDPREWVTTPRWIGSVKFSAGFLRGLSLKVGYNPIPEVDGLPANPYHGEVWGISSKGQKNALKRAAEWFVEIDGVEVG
ncbi:hypothetical protein [Sphingomonas sp. S2-65]|uniref:hypothetical protein n=1 Tax=Sphingomonas sp. S2-65 TaxID=2903960 RepID=UPI001F1762D9|nr:hypothetical protein [Sphingomonas sp. S2-65]UYY60135.1 hypothetical protein LZ586_08675 [Sphingomonas sp. S2-65]